MIRALAVPDRVVQLAIAKVLIDAGKRAGTVIAQEGAAAYELERWTGNEPEARHALNLRKWLTGPDAIGAEATDHALVTIPV